MAAVSALHQALVGIVQPATPQALVYLRPKKGKGIWAGYKNIPSIIRYMLIIAVVSLAGANLVDPISNALEADKGTPRCEDKTGAVGQHAGAKDVVGQGVEGGKAKSLDDKSKADCPKKEGGINPVFLLFVASLGACYSNINRANRYINTGTFDPVFIPTYVPRYVLGLIGGFSLGFVVVDHPDLPEFSPAILALLGGYSSRFFELLLERIQEVVLAAVRGNPADGEKQELQDKLASAKRDKAATDKETGADLADLLKALNGGATPDDLKRRVERMTQRFPDPASPPAPPAKPAPKPTEKAPSPDADASGGAGSDDTLGGDANSDETIGGGGRQI